MRLSLLVIGSCWLVAAWRLAWDADCRLSAEQLRRALGGAGLNGDQAADAIGIDAALWSRLQGDGGKVAHLRILCRQYPEFQRQIIPRLIGLLTLHDTDDLAPMSVFRIPAQKADGR